MAESWLIYGLVDPRDGVVCYVGATRWKLKDRLAKHIKTSLGGGSSKKDKWIQDLYKDRLAPSIIQLRTKQVSSKEELLRVEAWWVRKYRVISGDRLTNSTIGGSPSGWLPEVRAKHKPRLGAKVSEETRLKMSRSQKLANNKRFTGGAHTEDARRRIGDNLRSHLDSLTTDQISQRMSSAHNARRMISALDLADFQEIQQKISEGLSRNAIARSVGCKPHQVFLVQQGRSVVLPSARESSK